MVNHLPGWLRACCTTTPNSSSPTGGGFWPNRNISHYIEISTYLNLEPLRHSIHKIFIHATTKFFKRKELWAEYGDFYRKVCSREFYFWRRNGGWGSFGNSLRGAQPEKVKNHWFRGRNNRRSAVRERKAEAEVFQAHAACSRGPPTASFVLTPEQRSTRETTIGCPVSAERRSTSRLGWLRISLLYKV